MKSSTLQIRNQAVPGNDTPSFPLGSPWLHEQLCLATSVLACFLRAKPRSLTLQQISERALQPQSQLHQLCTRMEVAGLLVRDPVHRHAWSIPAEHAGITLWDVYVLVITGLEYEAMPTVCISNDRALAHSLELQWMQAALSAHQAIATQLRRFSLESIVLSARMPPVGAAENLFHHELISA